MARSASFAAALLVLLCGSTAWAADDGFVSLFDGKTLDGWIQRNGLATYRAEDGAIVGRTAKNSPNSFLCTQKAYCDFELTFEVQLDPALNSGVQIRSRSSKDYDDGAVKERVHGPQVEIAASPGGCSGFIYGEATRGWMSAKPEDRGLLKNGQWNQYRILAVGPRIQTWVNGVQVEDLTDEAASRCGFIGLQVHGVGDGGPFEVRWRNIKLKDLAPEKTAQSQDVQFTPAPDAPKK